MSPPLGHLAAAVPGDRAAQVFGQLAHRVDHRGGHGVSGVIARQVQQHGESGAALNQRADRTVVGSNDQIAFPMTRHGPISDLCRAVADPEFLSAAVSAPPIVDAAAGFARCALGGQAMQISAQAATGLHIKHL